MKGRNAGRPRTVIPANCLATSALIFASLQLVGCYIPAFGGKKPSKEALMATEPGTTTRADIVHRFGTPNALETDRFYVYEMKKGHGVLASPVEGLSLGEDRHRLLFEFDSLGVLSRWSMERAVSQDDALPFPDRTRQTYAATADYVEPAPKLEDLALMAWTGSTSFRWVGLSPDGSFLAALSLDGRLWLRDLGAGTDTVHTLPPALPGAISALEFNQAGQLLLATRKGVQVIDPVRVMRSGLSISSSISSKEFRDATALAIDAKGSHIAMGNAEGLVCVIDPFSGTVTQRIQAHRAKVVAVAFSGVGGLIASVASGDSVRIWATTTGRGFAVLPTRAETMRFSPDGSALAISTAGRVEIWHPGKPSEAWDGRRDVAPRLSDVFLLPYVYWTPPDSAGFHIAFSSDGRYVAVPAGNCVVYDTWERRVTWRYIPPKKKADSFLDWAFAPEDSVAEIATPGAIYSIKGNWEGPARSQPQTPLH